MFTQISMMVAQLSVCFQVIVQRADIQESETEIRQLWADNTSYQEANVRLSKEVLHWKKKVLTVTEENLAILSENIFLSEKNLDLNRKNAKLQTESNLKSKKYRLLCEVIEAKFGLDSLDGFLDPPHPQISTSSGFILFLT